MELRSLQRLKIINIRKGYTAARKSFFPLKPLLLLHFRNTRKKRFKNIWQRCKTTPSLQPDLKQTLRKCEERAREK
jgi:hypothetical protein